MTHYICKGGCKGVSYDFGFCGAETCPSHGEVLEECECEDGKHGGEEGDGDAPKDINGNVLSHGDSVQITKDLDVKGSSLNLKRGAKLKGIRLIGDPENIEYKQGKTTIVIKTCYLKKV